MTCEIVESASASIEYFLFQLDPDIRRLERPYLKISKKKQSAVFNQTHTHTHTHIYMYISVREGE